MRRSNTEKNWFYTPGGDLIGIATGSDACSEHEWGIKRMRYHFGCDDEKDGIERRRIRLLPEGLIFKETVEYTGLMFLPNNYTPREKQFDGWLKSELARPWSKTKEPALACAWDEASFGIVSYSDEGSKDRKNIKELYGAFQRVDIAFWPSIGVFHSGGGLILMIASRIPVDNQQELLEGDLDRKKLLKAAEETGIQKLLEKAGKRWFALSPKWAKEMKSNSRGDVKTKHEVIFWLNPMDQDVHNYGWYTVEDLALWAENKGPIPMTEKQKKGRRG